MMLKKLCNSNTLKKKDCINQVQVVNIHSTWMQGITEHAAFVDSWPTVKELYVKAIYLFSDN